MQAKMTDDLLISLKYWSLKIKSLGGKALTI